LNVENISLSRTTVASDLTASDFIWCPVIEDLLYVPTYHMHNNPVTYFTCQLRTVTLSTGVATMSSLAQLRAHDTTKQRQHRCNNVRLTESGNTRSKQLLVMPT